MDQAESRIQNTFQVSRENGRSPSTWAIFRFLRHMGRELDQKQISWDLNQHSHMQYQPGKQELNVQHSMPVPV